LIAILAAANSPKPYEEGHVDWGVFKGRIRSENEWKAYFRRDATVNILDRVFVKPARLIPIFAPV
jgi:hypothetical protein